MIKFLQFLIFLPIQIIFIPFTIIGTILVNYKELYVQKKLGISPTTSGATPNKWMLHYFGIRNDKMTVQFIKNLPVESHIGYLLMFGAAIIANRICGYKPAMVSIPKPGTESLMTFINTKTMDFDKSMEKYINNVDQVVVMGAGYDLRALQYTTGKDKNVFEIDLENAQNLKIRTMKKAGIKHDLITYISIDFNRESWVEKLVANGFDKTKKTFFLWESVTAYLNEDVVKDTLKKVAELSTEGSVIAQDFYSIAFEEKMKKLSKSMRKILLFGLDMSEDARKPIESLLQESGLTLTKLILYGQNRKTKRPFCAITEAEKK